MGNKKQKNKKCGSFPLNFGAQERNPHLKKKRMIIIIFDDLGQEFSSQNCIENVRARVAVKTKKVQEFFTRKRYWWTSKFLKQLFSVLNLKRGSRRCFPRKS